MKTTLAAWISFASLGIAPVAGVAQDFGQYWNRGKAEITSYDLEQARYGHLHPGVAVTVFVTEPFDLREQVKADEPGEGDIQVLKLNLTKKFVTGIYPYSMMTSVFTPVAIEQHPRTLKTTVSSQEWCGHTWTQMNWRAGTYQGEQRSYFETEGDRKFVAGDAKLEDEVWTRIRLSPGTLPTGEIQMIPGGLAARLQHRLPKSEDAVASMVEQEGDENIYVLHYPELERTLKITFRKAFPHLISGWEETELNDAGEQMTTRATLRKRMNIDYWNHHDPVDRKLRSDLGLPVDR